MGLDVIVIKLDRRVGSLDEITADVDSSSLGSLEEVRNRLSEVASEIDWQTDRYGFWKHNDEFALEIEIPQEIEPSSLHFTLRFGETWNDGSNSFFMNAIRSLFELYGWQSFSVSDNSSLLEE